MSRQLQAADTITEMLAGRCWKSFAAAKKVRGTVLRELAIITHAARRAWLNSAGDVSDDEADSRRQAAAPQGSARGAVGAPYFTSSRNPFPAVAFCCYDCH